VLGARLYGHQLRSVPHPVDPLIRSCTVPEAGNAVSYAAAHNVPPSLRSCVATCTLSCVVGILLPGQRRRKNVVAEREEIRRQELFGDGSHGDVSWWWLCWCVTFSVGFASRLRMCDSPR